MTRRKPVPAPEPFVLREGHALVLRTCAADLSSYNGFKWPKAGPVECLDWNPRAECGNGLHGLLWGAGEGMPLKWAADARWLVVDVVAADCIDLDGKVKFPRGTVVYCGDQQGATELIVAHGADPALVVGRVASDGDCSKLTGGDRSVLTGGDCSVLTGGHDSKLTGGDRSVLTGGDDSKLTGGDYSKLTGGDRSVLTGGDRSVLSIRWWDGSRCCIAVGYVGEGLKAGVTYRLNNKGEFVEVSDAP